VNTCIIRCGFLLLDSYLNLSRKSLSEDDIVACEESLSLAIAMQYQMTCVKQALGVVDSLEDAEMKDTKEMKPHIGQHIPGFIKHASVPRGFDTVRTENSHVTFVKKPYRASSRRGRTDTIFEEMLRRVHESRLMSHALSKYEGTFGATDYGRTSSGKVEGPRRFFDDYMTEQEMIYSVTFNKPDTLELVLNEDGELRPLTTEWSRSRRFLNPLGSFNRLQTSLFNCEKIQNFIHSFRSAAKGALYTCKLLLYTK